MKKVLLTLVVATLAALAGTGAAPAGAATSLGGGRADAWAPPPAPTGPQAGEIALGSFVTTTPTRGGGLQRGPGDLRIAPTCAVQCITGGVAYGRGPDARLVVTTDTPATIRIVVSGPGGYSHQEISGSGATSFSADFDDLTADTQYQGTVVATDADGNSAVRAGSFRTLQRDVEVTFTEAHITAVPNGDEPFGSQVWFEGEPGPGQYAGHPTGGVLPLGINILGEEDTDRYLEVAVELAQAEPSGPLPCEVSEDPDAPEAGQRDCSYVQSAWFPDGTLDLDDRPAGEPVNHYWVTTQLELPGGGGLPPGFGLPLNFTVPISVEVTWTHG